MAAGPAEGLSGQVVGMDEPPGVGGGRRLWVEAGGRKAAIVGGAVIGEAVRRMRGLQAQSRPLGSSPSSCCSGAAVNTGWPRVSILFWDRRACRANRVVEPREGFATTLTQGVRSEGQMVARVSGLRLRTDVATSLRSDFPELHGLAMHFVFGPRGVVNSATGQGTRSKSGRMSSTPGLPAG